MKEQEDQELKELAIFENLLADNADAPENQEDTSPVEFNCIYQFDYWMRCAGIMNQVNSVYRYGHMTDCTRWRDNFVFCAKYAWKKDEERMPALFSRRQEFDKSKKIPTANVIWNMRQEPPDCFPPPLDK